MQIECSEMFARITDRHHFSMSRRISIRYDMIVSATDDLSVFDDYCTERPSAFLLDIQRRKRDGFLHKWISGHKLMRKI
jgi:hypothetical protein